MYYTLVYNCIYNLLHVHLKWMICAQIIFRIKWNPKLFYIFHSKYCYVPERQHMFPFYSKLAYIMFQEDRHKHLKCLGREENILLFFAPLIVAIHPSKLSTLCFSEARKQNLSIPALRLFRNIQLFGCLMVMSLSLFVLAPVLTLPCIFQALSWDVEPLSKSILRLKSIFCLPQINLPLQTP